MMSALTIALACAEGEAKQYQLGCSPLSWVFGSAMVGAWQARTKTQKATKLRQLGNKAKEAAQCTARRAMVVKDDGEYKGRGQNGQLKVQYACREEMNCPTRLSANWKAAAPNEGARMASRTHERQN